MSRFLKVSLCCIYLENILSLWLEILHLSPNSSNSYNQTTRKIGREKCQWYKSAEKLSQYTSTSTWCTRLWCSCQGSDRSRVCTCPGCEPPGSGIAQYPNDAGHQQTGQYWAQDIPCMSPSYKICHRSCSCAPPRPDRWGRGRPCQRKRSRRRAAYKREVLAVAEQS